jgi:hypothetical protein
MPFALLLAIAASLGVHALVLFGPDIDLSTAPAPPPLTAELLPLPKPLPKPKPKARPAPKHPLAKSPAPPALTVPQENATVPSSPPAGEAAPEATATDSAPPVSAEEASPAPAGEAAPVESRLPSRGMIRFRVDRGDRGFEIGRATHDWEIVDGAYRITSVTETTGLVALFKGVRIELESRGRLTADGLQPEHFQIRRDGRATSERAEFDWAQMQVSIAGGAPQPLSVGAQDLLSFHYQLGFLPHPAANNRMPIATGKKYETYQLESLGDEEIEIPAGTFRTLHLRAPGDNTTEFWLAYDYLLLPVKIRHIDRNGDGFVQVATEIQLSKD